MLRAALTLALLITASAAHAAIVSVSSASVHRDDGLVSVDIRLTDTAAPLQETDLSNLAIHVVTSDGFGNFLPLVDFGGLEFADSIFSQWPHATVHRFTPTVHGGLFTQDFFAYPWAVKADGHVLTAFFDASDAALGTYTVTPAWDGQLSSVVTDGRIVDGGLGRVWNNVPLTYETGRIVVHTPEPAAWVTAAITILGVCGVRLGKRKS